MERGRLYWGGPLERVQHNCKRMESEGNNTRSRTVAGGVLSKDTKENHKLDVNIL